METVMDRLTRWVIDMLRAQEDEERRKRRNWAKLDQLLSEGLEKPFTPYSSTRDTMSLLIADMADRGWKWSGIGLDNMAYGTVAFSDGTGKGGSSAGDTFSHATAAAAAKALGIPDSDWITIGFVPPHY